MSRWHSATLATLLACGVVLFGQQQQTDPHAGYVYPAGGQRGTTVRVTVGGQFLDGVDRVLVSGAGVTATVVGLDKPMTQQQLRELREKLTALQQRRTEPGVREEIESARRAIADYQRRILNRAIAERVTLDVAVAGDAPPGPHALRVETPRGLTNPIAFAVGEHPEIREEDAAVAAAGAPVTLPITLNGRLVPGEVERAGPPRQAPAYVRGDSDRYRFTARRGQEILITASARALIPYLADAVPGWFQATLTLFDAAGREVAYADDEEFDPDPRLRYRAPADGEYAVEIKDALYRGREDFVYRVTIADAGAAPSKPAGCASDEPASSPRPVPLEVSGCIARPGERDAFRFQGHAGDRIVAEVTARRSGSPLDSAIELLDSAGRRLAFNDDSEDRVEGLLTHDADSLVATTLPRTGTYTLRVSDAQSRGGAAYGYRLRIGPPRPDFALRAAPSTINVAPGGSEPIAVVVRRVDGFDGEVALALRDAPRGFALAGALVPAGKDSATVTLTVPPRSPRSVHVLRLVGRATIDGRVLEHDAVAADDMMQAFAYHHLVPADALRVAVSPRRARRPAGRSGL